MTWKTTGADPEALYNGTEFPSLDLKFADNKTLVDEVSGDNLITFTRSSIGTYVDANGVIQTASTDTPRFDHDPVTGESLGLLIEESRTNYQPYSSSVPTAYSLFPSGTVNTTAPTATTAPDGTSTTDALIESLQTNVQHSMVDAVINTFEASTGVWTYSVFAKLVSGTRLLTSRIYGAGSNSVYVEYNLLTGTSSNGSSANVNVVSHGMDEYPNGWWRCWVTFNAPGTQEGWLLGLANGDAAELPFYDGDGTSGVYIWGAQLEQASFPTSYIPTSGSTVTRAADVAEITGSNFSSWYNQSEGTVFVDAICNNLGGGGSVSFVGYFYTSSNQYIDVLRYQPTARAVISNTSAQSVLVTTDIYGSSRKSAHAFKSNDFALSVDGGTVLTDTLGSLPSVSNLKLGNDQTDARSINGHISRFTYYPYRLSNTRLQTITT